MDFQPHVPPVLVSPYTRASSVGDFDGDGNGDVALAIYQKENSFSADSIIMFGKGNRTFKQGEDGIPTYGAINAVTVPS